MLKIDIVSGFLGAGKTTFIKRLLETDLKNEKIVLIENEFGEISVDSIFLSESKIDIAELSQGCICCSLVGDFAKSLNEVIEKYQPDRIIVEPSGVGKLSDVIKAIEDSGLAQYLNTYVCIVDATKAKVYSKNFKEFFVDQIANAKTVVLSRCDIATNEKIKSSLEVIRKINEQAKVVVTNINELNDEELLNVYEKENISLLEQLLVEEKEHHGGCCCHEHEHHHEHHESCGCHEHEHHHEHHEGCGCHEHEHHHEHHEGCGCHEHEHHHEHHEGCGCHEHEHHHEHHEGCGCHEHEHHHEHHEGCGCHEHEHHHQANEVFNSVSIETPKVYCMSELESLLKALAFTNDYGYILRAKGVVKTTSGWKKFNITPEELLIEDNPAMPIGVICVIGVDICKNTISKLF